MQQQVVELLRQWNIAPWAWNAVIIAAAILLGLLVRVILLLFVKKNTDTTARFSLFRSVLQHLGKPLSYFFPIFLFTLLLPVMRMPPDIMRRVRHGSEIAMIIVFSWLIIQSINVVQDYVIHRFDVTKANNLRERKIRTQLQFIRRILITLIIGISIAAVLLTFSSMRKIGTGLLTGVGVSGIIIGFAAQRSLGNLLAGFQIAFTQPIRIDDAVLVENEFGIIEEITLTYVVVRIWDLRRLILPINYFIEKPFQNWTRRSADMLGTVYLYADYTLPVDAVRTEFTRLVQSSPLWDGKASGLVVTNLTDKTVELRALVSTRNSGDNFDLRCYIREHLMHFIKQNYPDSLPKIRTELGGPLPQPDAANNAAV